MGTKNKPGEFDYYHKADPDEPIFTLLGRDPAMPWMVINWAIARNDMIAQGRGSPNDLLKIEEALFLAASTYRYWRICNEITEARDRVDAARDSSTEANGPKKPRKMVARKKVSRSKPRRRALRG